MSVMDEYIKIVQDAITKYLKLVFERKFNKQICDSYIKTYIDVRYYNVNERGNHRTLRKEILESLKEKKKRLSMELGVYSILLLWLGISGKGNAVINTIVTMLFILYNLENMFYIMPSKIEMMQAKTAEDGKIIKTQELKPLKKMDAEEYKKEYLKKSGKAILHIF